MRKGTIAVLSTIVGAAMGAVTVGKIQGNTIEQKAEKVDKFKTYYDMLNQWLILKQEGKSLERFFLSKGYKTIAIYGMGEMGNRLYKELKGTNVEVKYAIDKAAGTTYAEIDVFTIEDKLPEIDAVIVSAVFAFEEIEGELESILDCPILSLKDVIYDV